MNFIKIHCYIIKIYYIFALIILNNFSFFTRMAFKWEYLWLESRPTKNQIPRAQACQEGLRPDAGFSFSAVDGREMGNKKRGRNPMALASGLRWFRG